MPSLRAILMSISLTSLLQTAASTPVTRRAANADACGSPLLASETPTLPALTNATTQLPSTNLTLAYVVVGRGIQNYTCTSTSTDVVPVALGAVATLYDATSLAYSSEDSVNAIPPTAVYMPLPNGSLVLSVGTLDVLGKHYFDSTGTPTFDLFTQDKMLHAAKIASVNAPSDANIGPDGTGAVPWLYLTAKAGYISTGASAVYRVITAGGQPPATCASALDGLISVQYSALYWLYD